MVIQMLSITNRGRLPSDGDGSVTTESSEVGGDKFVGLIKIDAPNLTTGELWLGVGPDKRSASTNETDKPRFEKRETSRSYRIDALGLTTGELWLASA